MSDNTKDFGDPEVEGSLRKALADEAAERGAGERIVWVRTLADAVARLAERAGREVSDLGKVKQNLRDETVRKFLESHVLTDVVGTALDVRRCGFPLNTLSAELVGATVVGLTYTRRGAGGSDTTIVEYVADIAATAAIKVTAPFDPEQKDIEVVGTENGIVSCLAHKRLVVRGLLSVDNWYRPQRGEVTRIEAVDDDPGRKAWRTFDVLRQVRLAPDVTAGISEFLKQYNAQSLAATEALRQSLWSQSVIKGLASSLAGLPEIARIRQSVLTPDYLKTIRSATAASARPDPQPDNEVPPEGQARDVTDTSPPLINEDGRSDPASDAD